MAVWREYYEDFLQDTLLYREKLTITPRQYMRWAADAVQKIQRRTGVSNNIKTLTYNNGTYDIGMDILSLDVLIGPDGMEIPFTSLTQNQMILDQQPLGLNEVPFNFSLKRDNGYIKDWGMESRVAVLRDDYTIEVFPDPQADLTLKYTVDFHRFSESSSQWTAWFPTDDDFETQFTTTGMLPEIQQFDEGVEAYCLMKYLRAIHNPDWQLSAAEFKDAVDTITANKQQFYTNGTANYNLGPVQ